MGLSISSSTVHLLPHRKAIIRVGRLFEKVILFHTLFGLIKKVKESDDQASKIRRYNIRQTISPLTLK